MESSNSTFEDDFELFSKCYDNDIFDDSDCMNLFQDLMLSDNENLTKNNQGCDEFNNRVETRERFLSTESVLTDQEANSLINHEL